MTKNLIKIWGDVVNSRELFYSILIIGIPTMGLHLLAPKDNNTLGLFLGLLGAVIGFFISVFLFKPKRVITFEDQGDE